MGWGWGGGVTAWFMRLRCAAWAYVRVCAVCVAFVCAAVVTIVCRCFLGEFDWALLEAFVPCSFCVVAVVITSAG